MDPEARLSLVNSRFSDIQHGRSLYGGACATSAELGPAYQESAAFRCRVIRVPNVYPPPQQYRGGVESN